MTEIHPSLRIDKAKKKRYDLLCTEKSFRSEVSWFRILLIGFTGHIKIKVPRYSGDRHGLVAYRSHIADLISIYAPRRTAECGHNFRGDTCQVCAEQNACDLEFKIETFKIKKGYTPEQWRERCEEWKRNNPKKVKELLCCVE